MLWGHRASGLSEVVECPGVDELFSLQVGSPRTQNDYTAPEAVALLSWFPLCPYNKWSLQKTSENVLNLKHLGSWSYHFMSQNPSEFWIQYLSNYDWSACFKNCLSLTFPSKHSSITSLDQESVSFFNKRQVNKQFRLFRPHSLYCNYSVLKVSTDDTKWRSMTVFQ